MLNDLFQLVIDDQMLQERRGKRRFQMRLPIEVRLDDAQAVMGITRDVSANGLYFFLLPEIEERAFLELILTFPPEITLSQSLRVRCKAKLVRMDRQQPEGVGIAAQIQRYEFLTASSA